jgi:hypothetical protein
MKLAYLLHQRQVLLRQARLANLAFAYWHLGRLVTRIANARLHGLVSLQFADPAAGRLWPVLTALEGSQAVIEEHFTDDDILGLADLLAFLTGEEGADKTFRLEDNMAEFLVPLARKLAQAGVELESVPRLAEPPGSDHEA